jgi:N-acyl-D-amino-acid deacylase
VFANVRIRDGKIVDLGPVKPVQGEMILDVKGMLIAPGFIDFQNVSPVAITAESSGSTLLTQGITTAVLGSDGTGPYSVEDFMLPFDEKPPVLNIAMLVGHATVRKQIMGPDYKRAANADETQRMRELVSDAMKQGAFGLGIDLQHEPGSFSTPDEVMALVKTTAMFGGAVVMNLRNETDKLADAIKEAVSLAREGKVAVQVLTTNKTALTEIDKARAQRVDISADSYSFAQLVRDKGVMLERSVQRMTGTPASRIALRERGILKKGAPADITIFNPTALSAGIKFVFVNGSMVIKDGQPTTTHSGQALR